MTRVILTDIEGTTSSLSFVKEVLFPYSRDRLIDFIAEHGGEPEVARELDEVRRMAGRDLVPSACAGLLIEWIDQDRKATPLKSLQGMIWEHGYRRGDFQGHIYEDAARKLRDWHSAGLALYVFSSGSVHAQQLLFAHTGQGDLTPLFSGYFDTRIGPKQAESSYRAIAAEIGTAPEAILFLSDAPAELDAARLAGCQTVQVLREGVVRNSGGHALARNFDEIMLAFL
jgi:enolase-phosphatase E1